MLVSVNYVQLLILLYMYYVPKAAFNVQKFRIEEINDTVLLTCVFADNSYAYGCIVHSLFKMLK